MTPSEKIISTIGALRERSPTMDLASQGVLIHNLIWVHQVIVASESLMVVAEQLSNGALGKYLRDHLEEERDHAKWLAEDLKTAGVDVAKVPLNRHAVELAGTQYYLVHHVSPTCLLGYMAVLEGFPFPASVCDQLEQLHGKPLLRCLRYHAENDLEHRKKLFRVIDQVGSPLVFENAIRTQYLIDEAFRAHE